MSPPTDTTERVVENEGLKIRNWVLAGAVLVLFLVVQITLTNIISNAASEIKATNEKLTKLTTTVEVEAVRNESVRQRVADLEQARTEAGKLHRDLELRLNSLEQRAAIHDQWISSHNR